jgi:hypothetical protein
MLPPIGRQAENVQEVRRISLGGQRDVNIKFGNYYRRLIAVLEQLEYWAEPLPPVYSTASTQGFFGMALGLPAIAATTPTVRPLLQSVTAHLNTLGEEANALLLVRTKDRIERTRIYLNSLQPEIVDQLGDANLKTEIRVLREALEDDLEHRLVFFPEDARITAWLKPHPFGEGIYTAFPSAKSDISWAIYSNITANWTACVFYLMRAVEHAMREVALLLGIKKIGKKKIPIDYARWQMVCDALHSKIDKLQASPIGPKKAAELQFYSRVASEIEWFNEIWRKNVAHARTLYRPSDADNAMIRARDFFQLLATRIKEKP